MSTIKMSAQLHLFFSSFSTTFSPTSLSLTSFPPSSLKLTTPRNSLRLKTIEQGKQDNVPLSATESNMQKNLLKEEEELKQENKDLGTSLKEELMKRKDVKKVNETSLWTGVAEEVKEIEWPTFGKVLGITGVVLGVIAGSSIVLLTVNAVFAELSDQVFVGRGFQDFFG